MKLNYKTPLTIIVVPSCVVAMIIAGVIMYIALDHNPMGEYCEFIAQPHKDGECVIQWAHLLYLGGATFMWVFLFTSVALSAIVFIHRVLKHKLN